MNCYYCGAYLDSMDTCPNCEADVKIWKKDCQYFQQTLQ